MELVHQQLDYASSLRVWDRSQAVAPNPFGALMVLAALTAPPLPIIVLKVVWLIAQTAHAQLPTISA